MKKISDKDLRLEDIPPNNSYEGAAEFAHALDQLDSFDETAKISKQVKERIKENRTDDLSLRELRISLFFYFRSLRHSGTSPNSELINKHLDLIRIQLTE